MLSITWFTGFRCMRLLAEGEFWINIPPSYGREHSGLRRWSDCSRWCDVFVVPCRGTEHSPCPSLIVIVCVLPTGRRWICHPEILHTAENRLYREEVLLWRRSSRQVSSCPHFAQEQKLLNLDFLLFPFSQSFSVLQSHPSPPSPPCCKLLLHPAAIWSRPQATCWSARISIASPACRYSAEPPVWFALTLGVSWEGMGVIS